MKCFEFWTMKCDFFALLANSQLLEVDETMRLGKDGSDSVKCHVWFSNLDWDKIKLHNYPVPAEILLRIELHLQNHSEDLSTPVYSPSCDITDLNTPEWLEDW